MINEKLIFDVGAHLGEDTEFYLKKGYSVIAVEANPDLAHALQSKFCNAIEDGKLVIIDQAISNSNGSVKFYKYDQATVWGTTELSYVQRNKTLTNAPIEVVVKSIRLRDLFEQYGCPYYLKIDIEGADTLCLQSLLNIESKPRFISVETSATSLDEVIEQLGLFSELGYHEFKVVGQHRVHLQKCPNLPLEGEYVDHHFKGGESGLFGEEAPGVWGSESQALKAMQRFFRHARLNSQHFGVFRKIRNRYLRALISRFAPDGTGWYDIHAKRR